MKIYEEAGINRFSIGLQTAIDEQLEDLGRIHTARDYVYATKLLKGKNFSTDIMLGLKNQTKEDIRKTVELAHAFGSKHISRKQTIQLLFIPHRSPSAHRPNARAV